eukprot:1318042-Amorphochlora_amoeboformis.AAC.3
MSAVAFVREGQDNNRRASNALVKSKPVLFDLKQEYGIAIHQQSAKASELKSGGVTVLANCSMLGKAQGSSEQVEDRARALGVFAESQGAELDFSSPWVFSLILQSSEGAQTYRLIDTDVPPHLDIMEVLTLTFVEAVSSTSFVLDDVELLRQASTYTSSLMKKMEEHKRKMAQEQREIQKRGQEKRNEMQNNELKQKSNQKQENEQNQKVDHEQNSELERKNEAVKHNEAQLEAPKPSKDRQERVLFDKEVVEEDQGKVEDGEKQGLHEEDRETEAEVVSQMEVMDVDATAADQQINEVEVRNDNSSKTNEEESKQQENKLKVVERKDEIIVGEEPQDAKPSPQIIAIDRKEAGEPMARLMVEIARLRKENNMLKSKNATITYKLHRVSKKLKIAEGAIRDEEFLHSRINILNLSLDVEREARSNSEKRVADLQRKNSILKGAQIEAKKTSKQLAQLKERNSETLRQVKKMSILETKAASQKRTIDALRRQIKSAATKSPEGNQINGDNIDKLIESCENLLDGASIEEQKLDDVVASLTLSEEQFDAIDTQDSKEDAEHVDRNTKKIKTARKRGRAKKAKER